MRMPEAQPRQTLDYGASKAEMWKHRTEAMSQDDLLAMSIEELLAYAEESTNPQAPTPELVVIQGGKTADAPAVKSEAALGVVDGVNARAKVSRREKILAQYDQKAHETRQDADRKKAREILATRKEPVALPDVSGFTTPQREAELAHIRAGGKLEGMWDGQPSPYREPSHLNAPNREVPRYQRISKEQSQLETEERRRVMKTEEHRRVMKEKMAREGRNKRRRQENISTQEIPITPVTKPESRIKHFFKNLFR